MDGEKIRTDLSEGRFEFSRHAFVRAVERNINDKEIRQAGRFAEIIEDYPQDKYSPSCLILGFTDAGRPLHLQVCYTDYEMLKIVTLYEPEDSDWLNLRSRRWS